ncbi:hypothetical protein WJX73_010615 [Symbiochloris irregularis]|uniref:LisH domain-containing protein n=1 Tax=Symbiochloris irregularis TaxID=706552 RepID=A0AAW1PRA3_9CHLO
MSGRTSLDIARRGQTFSSRTSTSDTEQLPPAKGSQVVQWLLANNYLMTALELLVEAQEVGRDDEVEELALFFADQQKFPAEELVKYDQKDAVDVQKLATEREARLSMTEYELRVTLEDVVSLQDALSRATSMDPSKLSELGHRLSGRLSHMPSGIEGIASRRFTSEVSEASDAGHALGPGTLSAKDKRQLNQAVRHYLAEQGFKLSALTLVEEGGGSVPTAAPTNGEATLPSLWRGYGERLAALTSAKDAIAARQKVDDDLRLSQVQGTALREELSASQAQVNRLNEEVELLRKRADWCEQQAFDAEAKARAAINTVQRTVSQNGEHPAGGLEEATEGALADVAKAFNAVTVNDALGVVASAVPRIIPHVLINKREELLPLLEALIEAHGDAQSRDKLSHALFNIVKKPNAAQRRMILDSCTALARRIGPLRTADELLPQAWEQVEHRHPERRLLVAEACAELAGMVPPPMASSLILSMLQTLSTDADASVRGGVAVNLAQTLPFLLDTEKVATVQGIMLDLAYDPARDVQDLVIAQLLPHFLAWVKGSDRLHTSLLPAVLLKLEQLLKQCPVLGGADEELVKSGQAELRLVGEQQQWQAQALLRLFVALLPALRASALAHRPDTLNSILCNYDAGDSSEAAAHAEQTPSSTHLDREDGTAGTDIDGDSVADSRAETSVDPLGGVMIANDTSSNPPGTPASVASQSARSMYSVSLDEAGLAESVSEVTRESLANAPSEQLLPASLPSLPVTDGNALEGDGSVTDWQAGRAFSAWLEAGDGHRDWVQLSWLIETALPHLLTIIRCIPASDDTELLRRRVCSTVRSICSMLGPAMTAGAVEPLFVASATVPHRSCSASAVPHTANVAFNLIPQGEEGMRVGRQTVLPQLLAGVLPLAGPGALTAMLQGLCADAADGQDAWMLQHVQDAVSAVHFCGQYEEVQAPLLSVMRELANSTGQGAHMCAGMLGGAMVACLSLSQVAKQVLPVLEQLTQERNGAGAREMAVDALGEVWRAFAPNAKALQTIHKQLETCLALEDHEMQLSVIRALTARAPAVTPAQLEFLLQKVLHILATMAQRSFAGRSPVQLKDMATALFEALIAVDAAKSGEQTVALHLVAALQSLRREHEFLSSQQLEQLTGMLSEVSANTPAMSLPPSTSAHVGAPPQAAKASPSGRASRPSRHSSEGIQLESISSPPDDDAKGKLPARSIFGLPKRQTGASSGTSLWKDHSKKLFRSPS